MSFLTKKVRHKKGEHGKPGSQDGECAKKKGRGLFKHLKLKRGDTARPTPEPWNSAHAAKTAIPTPPFCEDVEYLRDSMRDLCTTFDESFTTLNTTGDDDGAGFPDSTRDLCTTFDESFTTLNTKGDDDDAGFPAMRKFEECTKHADDIHFFVQGTLKKQPDPNPQKTIIGRDNHQDAPSRRRSRSRTVTPVPTVNFSSASDARTSTPPSDHISPHDEESCSQIYSVLDARSPSSPEAALLPSPATDNMTLLEPFFEVLDDLKVCENYCKCVDPVREMELEAGWGALSFEEDVMEEAERSVQNTTNEEITWSLIEQLVYRGGSAMDEEIEVQCLDKFPQRY